MRISDWSSDVCSSDLLIVAPNERKVRIEVGYGLEGDLPDATANAIITNEILPAFRQGDYPAGIAAGVDAIILAIEGAYQPMERRESRGFPPVDRKSTRLNSSHYCASRMPSSA